MAGGLPSLNTELSPEPLWRASLRQFQPAEPRKIRDPDLPTNPRPGHAEFVT